MRPLVATPCYGGAATVGYLRTAIALSQAGAAEFLLTEGEADITRARANLVARFLRESDFDPLCFIDADVEIAPADFMGLMALPHPIRGAAVQKKRPDRTEDLSCYGEDGRQMRRASMPLEPFACRYLGAAVLCITRAALERLWLLHEETLAYEDDLVGRAVALFDPLIRDKAKLTEDFAFCERARAAGFQIWCDPSIVVSHYGQGVWRA